MTSKKTEVFHLGRFPSFRRKLQAECSWKSRHRGVMKNLHFRVVTMLIGLCFTGTMTNPSRKSSVSLTSECQWKSCLLTNCSFTGKRDTPVDRPQTAATEDASARFFRALLQSHVKKDCNIKHLDLSNHLISKITLSPLAHFHALEILNLSNNSICSVSLDLPSPKSPWRKRHRSSLRHGLPFLKVLILQRNKLSDVPKGLWKLKSLQSLDLSFNGISQIGLSDFRHCPRLENLNLKSNRIFRIHPGAFEDLKNLQTVLNLFLPKQVVDLSNNVLTTILPMMILALDLPRLEVDLADNRWHCDWSVAAFQNFISESWRKTWNRICSKSVGNEEAHPWTPQSGISRETTHLPLITMNHTKSLVAGEAERPQEGRLGHFSTPGRKDPAGTPPSEKRSRLRRWARSAAMEEAPQNLALAVCLAVFITFLVAFCLGALARPFMDRLWQQRCRHKRPASDNAYSNQGFCEDMEAAGDAWRPGTDVPLGERQDLAVPDGTRGKGRSEPGGRQSRGRCGDHSGPGSGKDEVLLSDSEARSILRGQPNADHKERTPTGQDRVYDKDMPEEITPATAAREDCPSEPSVGVPAAAGRLLTVSGSIHSDSGELSAPRSREMTASLPKMQSHTKAQRAAENEKRGDTDRFPWEFSEETQVSEYANLPDAQRQRVAGASAEEGLPACPREVTPGNPGEMNPFPPVLPPGWGRDLHATPANVEPEQKCAPSDPQYELDSSYDSDEGSLFTLSSTSSDEARDMDKGEARGEESRRAGEPSEDEDSGVRRDNVMPLEDPEGSSTFQKIPGKCENQEDPFGKPLISGPDSGLYETHLESAPNTHTVEDALTLPGSPGNSPFGDETPGEVTYDYARALRSEAVEWQCSLRDLEFFNVDVLPQTPPCSEVPSDSDKSDGHETDLDIYTSEPCTQGRNTVQNDIPLKVTTGENLRPSQRNSEGGLMNFHPMDPDADEGLVCPLGDYDSRKVISQTRWLQSCGEEPALQCERGERGYAENSSKSQGPLFQEPPDKTSSVGTREPFSDRDWGTYSQEDGSQSETEDSHFYTQMQTRNSLSGAGSLWEDQLYYDRDQDTEPESQTEFK